jgi:hypothetical protein
VFTDKLHPVEQSHNSQTATASKNDHNELAHFVANPSTLDLQGAVVLGLESRVLWFTVVSNIIRKNSPMTELQHDVCVTLPPHGARSGSLCSLK